MCREHHILFDSKTKAGKEFRKHIIKVVVGEDIHKKICEVRDGKESPEYFGFTEIK